MRHASQSSQRCSWSYMAKSWQKFPDWLAQHELARRSAFGTSHMRADGPGIISRGGETGAKPEGHCICRTRAPSALPSCGGTACGGQRPYHGTIAQALQSQQIWVTRTQHRQFQQALLSGVRQVTTSVSCTSSRRHKHDAPSHSHVWQPVPHARDAASTLHNCCYMTQQAWCTANAARVLSNSIISGRI